MKYKKWVLLQICFFICFVNLHASEPSVTDVGAANVQIEAVPSEIVDVYAQQYVKYHKKFVEAGCLSVMRERGIDFLARQCQKDAVCFANKKQCKSDVFVSIGKWCQRLEGLYVSHPFFKQRYTDDERNGGLQQLLYSAAYDCTAASLLNSYEADKRSLQMNYDDKPWSNEQQNSTLLWMYRACESMRFSSRIAEVMKTVDDTKPVKISFVVQGLSPEIQEAIKYLQANEPENSCINLFYMACVVVEQHTQKSVSSSRDERMHVDFAKVYDFYLILKNSCNIQCFQDPMYKNAIESCLWKLISQRCFFQSLHAFESVGGHTTTSCLRAYLQAYYETMVAISFENSVGTELSQMHQQECVKLLDCYSQDARMAVFQQQCHNEMVQLAGRKNREALPLLYKLSFDCARNLKESAYAQKAHDMLAQRKKLQVDAQEWVRGVEVLENQYDACAHKAQRYLQIMHDEQQYFRDLRSVGSDNLEQKNNRIVRQSTMQKWARFVGLQRLVKQQRRDAKVELLQNQNTLALLQAYFMRMGRVHAVRQQQLDDFQKQTIAWQEHQQKLEEQRVGCELNVAVAAIEAASPGSNRRKVW